MIMIATLCVLLLWILARRQFNTHTILESLHDGVVLYTKKGKILYANKRAREYLSLGDSEIKGKAFASLGKQTGLFELCCNLMEYFGERKEDTITLSRPNVKSYHVSVAPVEKSRIGVLVINDRTSIDSMHVMGKNFVANASHELRTPITIIKGFAEMLQEMPEVSADMLEGIVEKILRNCERMGKLVKNLLTLADLDNMNLELNEPCDLVGLLDSCHYTILSLHPEAKIELLHNVSIAEIPGNPDLLELAILNLLENAIKYSQTPAKITTTLVDKEGKITVTISDEGKGIPKEDLPHIFGRFYTVDKAHTRKIGGAGLGLSIVKRICELHKISIRAESEGKGTSFILSRVVPQEIRHQTPQVLASTCQ